MNSKRRWLTPPAALAAGLAVFLAGCAGESPTSPNNPGGGTGGGTCTVAISMAAVSVVPLAGTADPVRATVTRNGLPVPDGTSVAFTTDFGFFNENGFPTVSKVTVGGFADVTVASLAVGTAHVKATLECGTGAIDIQFQAPPDGPSPFISSIVPDQGSCAGNDIVIINGGRFGSDINILRVTFGGLQATVVAVSATGNQITVRTPARTLANSQVPETVDVVVTLNPGTAGAVSVTRKNGYTYKCIDPNLKIFISSVLPASGTPAGGEPVVIAGGHFGVNIATTRVTFCGASAQITAQSDNAISVTTPRHTLANPNVPETCDVVVSIDLGLVTQQSVVAAAAFTYRDPASQIFVSSIVPNAGSPNGAETVTINGGNFGTNQATTRVTFCGANAQITGQTASTLIVTTPAHPLSNPSIPEACDVTVTINAGVPGEQSTTVPKGFTYRDTTGRVFISSVAPTFGSPAGGDLVVLSGGNFGNTVSTTRVTLCGVNAQIQSVTDNTATITTPRHDLANPAVAETCDVTLTRDFGLPTQQSGSLPQAYTYRNAAGTLFISTVVPNVGSSNGGDIVTVNGGGFGQTQATTRVTFCGQTAQITGQNDGAITVGTPRHPLANPAIPETCDVAVTINVGSPNERTSILLQSFTFRDTAGRMFMSSVTPNLGTEQGGDTVVISGGNFGTSLAAIRVTFCGTNAQVTAVSDNSITVTTPRHLLANPSVPETCDVAVTRDQGLPSQQNAVLANAFSYRGTPGRAFISSVVPNSGAAKGGDLVVINGGGFGTNIATTRVSFCSGSAQIVAQTVNSITVTTPRHTLANPSVPEVCDVTVVVDSGLPSQQTASLAQAFTFREIAGKPFISSVLPSSGSQAGGEAVVLSGGNFGTVTATTRVTFCGTNAQISAQSDSSITVLTPRHINANPAVGETCDVAVFTDYGLITQQVGTLPQAFTYRGGGGGTGCNTDPAFFVSSITPNAGPPDGGTSVTIIGGGFGTNIANIRVDFGSTPAQVTSVSNNSITVTSPRHTLANPNTPEIVDIIVTDLGSSTGRCARLTSAFSYSVGSLTPQIFSISPTTGPNDASTRVTIFGTNFQFPIQVFLTAPACGGAQVEATVLNPVQLQTIVFATPIASGGNACLANALATVQIRNPLTNQFAISPISFKYYGCPPTVAVANPVIAPYNQTTQVTINGQNFEEPVQITYTITSPGSLAGQTIQPINTSVSSALIVITMPPLTTILQGVGSPTCTNVTGTITIRYLSLSCPPTTADFTYRVDPPSITSASPTSLNQDGSPFGSAPGTAQQIIDVNGANFVDPMTVSLLKDGSVVAGTTTNNAVVSNPGHLTFTAPAVPNSAMNRQNCTIPPSNAVVGTRFVPTSFGIRVTNTRTGCFTDLPNILVYNPADITCLVLLQVTTASLPAATICTPYAAPAVTATGGTPPYTFSASGLPPGLFLNTNGTFGGTPLLAAAGAGGNQSFTATVTVTDALAATASQTYSILEIDPDGPFSITGAAAQGVGSGGGNGSALTANPNATPAAFTPISWTIVSTNPSPGPGTITLNSATGQSNFLVVSATVPATTYTIVVRATDSPSCGGPAHTNTFNVSLTKSP